MDHIVRNDEQALPAADGGAPLQASDKQGDGRFSAFSVDDNGFLTFKSGQLIATEATLGDAMRVPPEQIERAFTNRWDRHANIETNRPHDVLRRQAYDLSFGSDEQRRIRDSLPADKQILDLIEAFGNEVLLENFKRYLERRGHYFRRVSGLAPLLSLLITGLLLMTVFAPVAGLGGLSFSAGGEPRDGGVPSLFVPALCFSAVFAVVAGVVTFGLWKTLIADKLMTERLFYKTNINGSTSRMKGFVVSIQQNFVSLSVEAQKQLTDIKTRDASFIDDAKKYVRMIDWFPIRLSMIETFYRAVVDNYLEESAKVVLEADAKVFSRRQARWCAIASAVLITVAMLALVRTSAGDPQIALWAPLILSSISLLGVVWPLRENGSSAHFIPQELAGIHFDVLRRRTSGIFAGTLPASFVALIGLLQPGAPASQTADGVLSLMALIIFLNAILIGAALVQNVIAYQLYRRAKTRIIYNGNIVDEIKEEMDSADWDAFNRLRSDVKMSDIYESVFTALQDERKKRT